jgi:hypothetical protein
VKHSPASREKPDAVSSQHLTPRRVSLGERTSITQRPMRLLHRITAGVSTMLLLQLSMLGSGSLCPARLAAVGHHSHESVSRAATHHMNRVAPTMPHQATDIDSSERCDEGRTTDVCGGPVGNATCVSMSMCSLTVSEPSPGTRVVASSIVRSEHGEPLATVTGPTAAPELPPPRA